MKNRLQFLKESFMVTWPFYLILCFIFVLVMAAPILAIGDFDFFSFSFILLGLGFIIVGLVQVFHKEYRRVFLKHGGALKDLKGGYVFAVLGICFIILGIIGMIRS